MEKIREINYWNKASLSLPTRTKESTAMHIAMFECEFQRGMKINPMNQGLRITNKLDKLFNFE